MSQDHIGDILPLKNRVIPVDNNTIFLAHYDLNENDVLKGISPSGYRNAVWFNGSGTYIKLSNPIKSASVFTICFWIKHNNPVAWTNILTFDTGADGTACRIEKSDISNEYRWYVDGCFPNGSLIFTHSGAQWDHIALVCNGANVYCYKNGVQTFTAVKVATNLPNCDYINIGRRLVASYWNGSISDISIWDYARSLPQIQTDINKNLSGDEPNLKGLWKLNEGSGTIAYDLSNSANDAVIANGSWSDGRMVATLRSDGYFGGGIAVDLATENFIATKSVTNYTGYHSMTKDGCNLTFPMISTAYALVIDIPDLGSLQGRTFAYSGYMKKNGVPWIYTESMMNAYNAGGSSLKKYFDPETGYFEVVEYFDSTSTWVMHANGGAVAGDIVTIENFQMEEKTFPTSFVNGIRGTSSLQYKIDVSPNDFTLNFWAKTYSIVPSSQQWYISMFPNGVIDENNRVYFRPATSTEIGAGRVVGGTIYSATAGSVIEDTTTWHMYTLTSSDTVMKIYQDGKLIASGASVPILTGSYVVIDLNPYQNRSVIYDELRIDNIARSEEEIASWYHSNSPFYPRGIYKTSY